MFFWVRPKGGWQVSARAAVSVACMTSGGCPSAPPAVASLACRQRAPAATGPEGFPSKPGSSPVKGCACDPLVQWETRWANVRGRYGKGAWGCHFKPKERDSMQHKDLQNSSIMGSPPHRLLDSLLHVGRTCSWLRPPAGRSSPEDRDKASS